MKFVPHGTDCIWRPPARRRLASYPAEERAVRMAAWQEERLAEMPVIERRVLETSDLHIAGILGRMPGFGKARKGRRGRRKRMRGDAEEERADVEDDEDLLLNLTSPRKGKASKQEHAEDREEEGEDDAERTKDDSEADGDEKDKDDDDVASREEEEGGQRRPLLVSVR